MPNYPVMDEPLPAGMVTLDAYTRDKGYSRGTILGRARRAAFPARAGTLRRVGRGRPDLSALGGRPDLGPGVYREAELDRYFAAHPVLPAMAEPLAAGLITLPEYAALAGRPNAAQWGSRRGFPAPVGRLAADGRKVYRKEDVNAHVEAHPGLAERAPLSLAGRDPDARISLTMFCEQVAHTGDWWMLELRRRGEGSFPRAGPGGLYRLGDLAAFYDAATAAHPVRVRDPALVEMGRLVAAARKAAGLTQSQLGAKAGYKRATISGMEIGSEPASAAAWEAVDRVLGASGKLAALRAAWAGPRGGSGR